jgi:DNA-binding beta-propeller fold protein YncE
VLGTLGAVSFGVVAACGGVASALEPPRDVTPSSRAYYAYVCSESEDEVALVRFDGTGLERLEVIAVGSYPAEIEGPHGLSVAPDGGAWYVSIAHGLPFGSIHKYSTVSNEWLGDVTVGMFPATMAIAGSTGLLYAANFDLHGDPEPSSVSVVETSTMTEVARIETGIMPHGSRLSAAGDRHYSVSMMQDELVEIDALRFEIARRLPLGSSSGDSIEPRVKPTWVSAPSSERRVYVAGSGDDAIYEIDLDDWRVSRRLQGSGRGPYNLAVAEDRDLLVVTYKQGAAVGFWSLAEGREVARVATSRRVPHGVVITPDGLYSFVTVEGVGAEPGVVELYDNRSFRRLATLDVGKQAGGIALWRGPQGP